MPQLLWIAVLLLVTACSGALHGTAEPHPTVQVARPFHVIAHRGASAYAPENTLPAFELARGLGAFEVELDLQLSGDGSLVVFHDATLDEKTNGRGRVSDHTLDDLRQLEIGSWFDREHPEISTHFAGTPLITLRELFEHFGERLFYHLEIKGADRRIAGRIVELVHTFDLAARVMLTSFSREQLARVKEHDPQLPICLLVPTSGDLVQSIAHAQAAGFQQVGIPAAEISREIVRMGHQSGLEVRAWGVKNDSLMERVIASGANGMTTDWPDRLLTRLRTTGVEP